MTRRTRPFAAGSPPATAGLRSTADLEHSTDKGDGVRARVVGGRTGVAGEWTVRNSQTGTRVESLAVTAGDTVDLVTDCRAEPSFDGFRWTVTVRLESAQSDGRRQWDSAADFRGPQPELLSPWVRLAQMLLMTNEFAYVD